VSGIKTAIILAAGQGSRLRSREPYKPLCPVGGVPLLEWAIEGLAQAGISRVIVVTGYGAEAVEAHLLARSWPAEVEIGHNADWALPNGVSARAAAPLLNNEPALLVMCDHVVDPALYRRVRSAGAGSGLRLGIDRRLRHPWVDLADVTRVRTQGERIVAIGKGLEPHDAYDTGVFAVGPRFFSVLAELEQPSLTDAVRVLAGEGAAEAVDATGLDWIDIDDGDALAKANQAVADAKIKRPSRSCRPQ
jgi:choline kinase